MVKAFFIVGARPLIAYSNNFDFVRQASCVGVWPVSIGIEKGGAASYPANNLVVDRDVRSELCSASIDNIFPYIAARGVRTGGGLDFRAIGAWKLVFVFTLLLGTVWAFDRRSERSVAVLLWIAVFSDLAVLLYFNTLYNELSVVLGLVVTGVCAAFTFVRRELSMRMALVWGAGLALLGLSKVQYALLAPCIAALAVVACAKATRASKLNAVAVLLVGICMPIVLKLANPVDYGLASSVAYANATDTVLGAVLPEAESPEKLLELMQLPQHCEAGAGKNWYSPGVAASHPCPELRDFGRSRLLPAFIADPSTFFGPFAKSVSLSRPIVLTHLGSVEPPREKSSWRYQASRWSSLSTIWDGMPKSAYVAMVWLAMLAGLACGMRLLWSVWRSRETKLPLAIVCVGGAYVAYALLSSVFGDGYWELSKHAIGVPVGLAFSFTGLAVWLAAKCRESSR
jgi:hypothetical protein